MNLKINDSFIELALKGSISSAITTLLLYPLENIKINLQIQSKDTSHSSFQTGAIDFIIDQIKKDGIRSFYVGLEPYLLYTTVSWGVYFGFFEYFKKKLKGKKFSIVYASILAGIFNVLLTNPLSVLSNFIISQKKLQNKSWNISQALISIIKTRGIGALYAGLFISLMLVINPVITFSIQEKLFHILRSSIIRNDVD